jgi:hypothetical protein
VKQQPQAALVVLAGPPYNDSESNPKIHLDCDEESEKMFGIGPTEILLVLLVFIAIMIVRNHKARRT